MKQLILGTFFGFLLISSCTCGDNDMDSENRYKDTIDNGMTDGSMDNDENRMGNTGNQANDWEYYSRMYNLETYTDEQIREYREMHDELDWGNVPGFYPEASTRPLTVDDTKFLTDWGHKVMLNEIYARHGMRFTDEDLKDHFGRQEWYNASHDDVTSMLTEQERQNIAFLQNHPA